MSSPWYNSRVHRARTVRIALAVALIGAVAWAGWTLTRDRREPVAAVGAPAPRFRLPQIRADGGTGQRTGLRGLRGRGVLLVFFAAWCEPCVAELPLLSRLHARYAGEHFAVVGITSDAPANVAGIVATLPFPMLADRGGRVSARYGVDSLPRAVLIGPDGVVEAMASGRLGEPEASAAVERLVMLSRAYARNARSDRP